MKTLLITAIVTALGLTAATVSAQPSATNTAKVYYGDLNLASQAGRTTLDARIRFAANRVCGTSGADLGSRAATAQCLRAAFGDAIASVPNRGVEVASR